MNIVSNVVAASAAALLAASCGRAAGSTDPATTADPPSQPGVIVVAKDMLAAIQVDAVHERERPRTLAVAGKVQFDEDRVARILAPIAGQVAELRIKVGDRVGRDQLLCGISSREVASAVGEHAESHKDLDLSEKTLAMTQDLFDHQAASRIALQQAQNDVAKARSRVARTDEALRALGLPDEDAVARFDGRLPVRSPIAGVVIERHVNQGQFVQPDSTPLITVADLSDVWVLGDVFERDLRFVTVGRQASIAAAAYPGERFSGRVEYVSDTIDPATRTAKVRVAVRNQDGRLKPEMFASVTLGVAEAERVLTVPARAVFSEDGRTYVYAAAGPDRFVRRPVDLAPDDGGDGADRRVLKGLGSGDRIVVDGALLLREQEDRRAG